MAGCQTLTNDVGCEQASLNLFSEARHSLPPFKPTIHTHTNRQCWLEHLHDLRDSLVLPLCAVAAVVLPKSMSLEVISSTKRYSSHSTNATLKNTHLVDNAYTNDPILSPRLVSRRSGKAFTTGAWAVVSSSWLLLCITSLIPGKDNNESIPNLFIHIIYVAIALSPGLPRKLKSL